MKPTVTICGLGPGGVGLITEQTRQAIRDHEHRPMFLRTSRHPSASIAADAVTFDEIYDQGSTLAEVYREMAERVAAGALEQGSSLYIVPGSPLVLERAVGLLRQRTDIEIELLPAVSFLDATWASLGIDPVEEAVRLIDGHTFARDAAGQTGPLLVAHAHAPWVLSEIKLSIDAGDEQRVIVLQRLGTDDELITEVAWPELDRSVEPDHLTSLYIPDVVAPVAAELHRTTELMHRLRQECPWDQQQTHGSLRRYLLEESYEVLEAIDEVEAGAEYGYEHLEEELGDLWFQILFHSELAAESGEFTIADVARTAHDKLVSRHPHVFGDVVAADADAVASNWERIKQVEKSRTSVMDGIPVALPALIYAEKVVKKGARAGAPDETMAALTLLRSYLARPDLGDQIDTGIDDEVIGQMLLAMVAVARSAGIDAEGALRAAVDRAIGRFRNSEDAATLDRWIFG